MAVEADGAAGVEVIQQHVFLGQRVMIGRDVAAVHHELGIAVALADVAEHLVVGAVLLDDQKDVLDAEGRQIGDPPAGSKIGLLAALTSRVPAATCSGVGGGNPLQRAFVLAGVERAFLVRRCCRCL